MNTRFKNLMIALAISILAALCMTSCSSDDAATVNNIVPPVEEGLTPDWLEGEYSSGLFPNEDHSYIEDDVMHLNFAAFNEDVYYFNTEEMATSYSVDGVTLFIVQAYDGVDIIFKRSSEPNANYIQISLNDNGTIKDLGVFYKVTE